MIGLLFDLIYPIVIIGVSVAAHVYVAYVIAPRRAREHILHVLTGTEEESVQFQVELVNAIVRRLLAKQQFKDEKGNVVEREPIDFVLDRVKLVFDAWINSKKSVYQRDISGKLAAIEQGDADVSAADVMLMQLIPKKYQWIIGVIQRMRQE